MVSAPSVWVERGSPAYGRVSVGLFAAGFATFSLLYCAQPLLPAFARDFRVGAAESSLALSLTTGFLALAILAAGALSETVGRRVVMLVSICAAAVLNIAAGLASDWHVLLIARALAGLALGGVPAVAMAYLAEEIDPRALGRAMGLYVAGNAFGGMTGRVAAGVLTEWGSWRAALTAIGAVDLVVAVTFFALLPASRNFTPHAGLDPAFHLAAWKRHLTRGSLRSLFLIGFLAMGAFVTVYNYAGFRLAGRPYGLTESQTSLIFVVYLLGMAASSWAGALADRLGRGAVLLAGTAIGLAGVGLTLLAPLPAVIGGVAVVTIGFFTAHSVASGWVGRMATEARGHAASLYLLAYYLGSSVMGSVGGWFWTGYGWAGVAAFTGAQFAVALGLALRLVLTPQE
jgi:YNFM family putative membrane transporter